MWKMKEWRKNKCKNTETNNDYDVYELGNEN